MLKAGLENIEAAYELAKSAHREQKRESGERYFEHPKAVANIIIDELGIRDNWELIVSGLLHDVLEDSFMLTEERIRKNFGRRIALWLKLLTKNPKEGHHQRLLESGMWQPWFVKLVDRLHNMRTLGACKPEKQKKQVLETEKYYLPLADTLLKKIPKKYRAGAERLKAELEKVCAECRAGLEP